MRRIVTLAGALALLSSLAITPALAHHTAAHAHAKVIRVGLVTDVESFLRELVLSLQSEAKET